MCSSDLSYLNPDGFIFLKGERWKAVAEDAPVHEGERVEVVGVKGLTVTVRRPEDERTRNLRALAAKAAPPPA